MQNHKNWINGSSFNLDFAILLFLCCGVLVLCHSCDYWSLDYISKSNEYNLLPKEIEH